MDFEASKKLVVGGRPVFIGLLVQLIDGQKVPLTGSDIESITFSLGIKNTNTLGEYSRFPGSKPIEEFQDIPVDKAEVITPERPPEYYAPEFWAVLDLEPFKSSFIYYPPNDPILFEKPGIYVARVVITDVAGAIHPFQVTMTVR